MSFESSFEKVISHVDNAAVIAAKFINDNLEQLPENNNNNKSINNHLKNSNNNLKIASNQHVKVIFIQLFLLFL